MKNRLGIAAGVASGLLIATGFLSSPAAIADSARTMVTDGSPAATVSYNSGRNSFTITDRKADGLGVHVEYSFTGIAGVKNLMNKQGSGKTTTTSISVPSGATEIRWRIRLYNGDTLMKTDPLLVSDKP
ncbi:hypothetical protein [Microbacterium sp. NPDC089695]|uniref:hypothetical protein n=1 Tax=Microbacterium sp. NPDC089695 TaxID=3364198 RepID=UPI003825F564